MSGPPSAPSPWRALVILLAAMVVAGAVIVGGRALITGGSADPTPGPTAPSPTTTATSTQSASSSSSPSPTDPTQMTLLVEVRTDDGVGAVSQLMSTRLEPDGATVVAVQPGLLVDPPGGPQTVFAATALSQTPALSQSTLSNLLGVRIDSTWVLDRLAFAGLIDSIGGIYLDVKSPTVVRDEDGTVVVTLTPGIQRVDGPIAATYVLTRQPGEPVDMTQARFAEVMRQVLVHLPEEPGRVDLLLGSLGALSRTTTPVDVLARLLLRLRADVDLNRVESYALPVADATLGTTRVKRLEFAAAERLMVRDFGPSRLVAGPTQPARVLVFNASVRAGMAETARPQLEAGGFVFLSGGPATRATRSVIEVPSTEPALADTGAQIAQALGLPASAVRPVAAQVTTADVVVVLGADYRPTSPVSPAPTLSPLPTASP